MLANRLGLFIAMTITSVIPAVAEGTGDPDAGRRIVQASCEECHSSAASGWGAPDFHAVAAMPSTTALSLGVFMRTSHPNMPNLILSPAQLDDVIAYILSLRT